MSLVIASNEIKGTDTRTSQFQKPYTWSNHMTTSLVIPANSEVAVQSLKVNKDGTITVSNFNKFYVYWGVKLSNTIDLNDTRSAPHLVDLGLTSATDLTVAELATKITDALNRGVPTPETFGLAECSVIRNASGVDFQGFKLKFEMRDDATSIDNKPTNWINPWDGFADGAEGAGLAFNSSNNRLTSIANYTNRNRQFYNYAMATDTPLALNGGIYEVDLSNAGSTGWGVGLRRSQGYGIPNPEEYNPAESELGYSYQYQDFAVYAVQDVILGQNQSFKIRAYCSTYDSNVLDSDMFLTHKEVDYTTGNGSFTGIYSWSTNASNIDKIKFVVSNENVKVSLFSGATEYVLVNTTGDYKATVNGITRPIRYPPIRDTCRCLYPTAFLRPNVANDVYLTINTWGGRDITNFVYSGENNDWWANMVLNNLTSQLGFEVESTPALDTRPLQSPLVQPTYKGINASGMPEDYDFVLVVQPDNVLYTGTELANAHRLLGFNNMIVVDNASKSGTNLEISEFNSADVPRLKSTSSLFVRLNNLPVRSFNAGQGRRSQIIYSAPRFATGTDQQVGALFFESPEKTYISINNSAPINLNTIDIDIVNENETLAEDLLGKTVCTLHFREKK
jgi:hypothetical protein